MALKFNATGGAYDDSAVGGQPTTGPNQRLTPDIGGFSAAPFADANLRMRPTGAIPGNVDMNLDATGAATTGGLKIGPQQGPTMPGLPEMPPVKAPFDPKVDGVIDSRKLADSFGAPTEVPNDLSRLMQLADQEAARGNVTAAENYRMQYLNGGVPVSAPAPTGTGTGASSTGSTTDGASTDTSASGDGLTEADIRSLFADVPATADEYAKIAESLGIGSAEAELAKVNKQYAELDAVIRNVENDLRTELGGAASGSFFQAAVADRIRRLKPEYDRLTSMRNALSENVQSLRADALQRVGLSQNDIENRRNDRNDVRNGVMDLIDSFGSQAFASMDPTVVAELERRGGFLPGQLSRGQVKTLAERQLEGQEEERKSNNFQSVVENGRLLTFDRSTGAYKDSGITVPKDQESQFQNYIDLAKANIPDPAAALEFINMMTGVSGPSASGLINPTMTVGQMSDDQLGTLIASMARREGTKPTDRNARNKNPLNIKLGGLTKHWVDEGLATLDPSPATDGGQPFLVFKDAKTGLMAAEELLRSKLYSGQKLEDAMKMWSGGGYGADVLPREALLTADVLKQKEKMSNSGLTGSQKGTVASLSAVIKSANMIREYIKENKINTGPLAGRASSFAGSLGAGDPKFETLRGLLMQNQAFFQHAMTGTAIKDSEKAFYEQMIPTVNQDETRFASNLETFIGSMKNKRQALLSDPLTGEVLNGFEDISDDDFGSFQELLTSENADLPFQATLPGVGTYSFDTQENADKWKAAMEKYVSENPAR